MTWNRSTAMLFCLMLVLLTTGCDEQWCKSKYGLTVSPPDGPDVIIQPDGGGTYLEVEVDGTDQTVNMAQSVFVQDNRCLLRGDFIGIQALRLDFYGTQGGSPAAAQHVLMESDSIKIDVVKSAYGTVHWRIAQKASPFWTCTAAPTGGFTAGELPKEFHQLKEAGLSEETLGSGQRVDLQVQLPG